MKIEYLKPVSESWHRAWRIQVARMGSCPGEIDDLQRSAQLSQANYIMALAVEAGKVKSV